MKTIFLLIITISVLHVGYAQKAPHKKANHHFEQYQYSLAAKEFEEIVAINPTDTSAIEKLAHCYTKLNHSDKAEQYFAIVSKKRNADPENLKAYAQTLAANGKYDASQEWYKKYLTRKHDQYVHGITSSYNSLSQFYEDSIYYTIKNAPFNSEYSDFSPAYYKDGIVFCSARNLEAKKYTWDNTSYIDLFIMRDSLRAPMSLGKPVNTALHEGPATFSTNFDTIFFTRNNYINNKKSNSKEGVVKLKIYYSTAKDGIWKKEQELPFNNDEYSIGHPARGAGHKLYFVSDMPGGIGGTDIYYTTLANGQWSTPVNLGPEINTSGNEMFPFIDNRGDLYFASAGHPGLGGLDVFYAKSISGKFVAPKNLGHPINSSKDDFGFIVENNKGYFTSNRGNNPKDDNLYSFVIDKTRQLNIQAVNKNGLALTSYSIEVIAKDDAPITKNVESIFTNKFNCEETYSVTISKDGYLPKTISLSKKELVTYQHNETISVMLEEATKTILVTLQSTEGKKLADGTIEMTNLSTGEKKSLILDSNASSTVVLKHGKQYEFTGSNKLYKTKTQSLSNISSMNDDAVIVLALPSVTALFDENQIGQSIELEIRYDVNKSAIRRDAAKELDKLVAFLIKNPTIKVELGSHTDTRGDEEANHKLSQRRAESAVRYIVAKGISSKRLIPIGYGESDLKVKEAETDEDHQQNRRTTVKIVAL